MSALAGFRPYLLAGGDDDVFDFNAVIPGGPPAAPSLVGVMVNAGAGDDVLAGSTTADRLNGGDGDDLVIGNGGTDSLTDGAGSDVLVSGSALLFFGGGTIGDRLADSRTSGSTFFLQNDGDTDILIGFKGAGGWVAGPQDFLWLRGYGAGASLLLLGVTGVETDGSGAWTATQSYAVRNAAGTDVDQFVLVTLGATQAAVMKTLVAGDYAWMT